jgi:alginate O-acetyltransferase complex protein AlgI
MLFNTSTFLVFMLIVFSGYWMVKWRSAKWPNFILLVSSYLFYGWWDWRFLVLIFISSLSDYILGLAIHNSQNPSRRKLFFSSSLLINLGLLGFFKYFGFFIESFASLLALVGLHASIPSLQIILPVGISFYTFQTMSYTIDIYRRKLEPTRSPLSFFTFVAFFPQLVAGPIERASHLIPQFEKKPVFLYNQAKSGMQLILWGLFKKMVIADRLSVFVEQVYANPGNFTSLEILIATLFFGLQIYCDFSGYSDIAIGVGRLFGKELMANFRTPYLATSFREFWQRWHISLSTWFRDYIYIPLGGNRCSPARWRFNIIATFAISGLWHGANLTFLAWGLIHGLFLLGEHFASPIIKIGPRIKKAASWIATFALVNLCWVFFRSSSLTDAFSVFSQMGKFSGNLGNFRSWMIETGRLTESGWVVLLGLPVFIAIELFIKKESFDTVISGKPTWARWGTYYLLLAFILFLGVLNSAPQFIYFQF